MTEKKKEIDYADMPRKLSGKTWVVIWTIICIACIAVYPTTKYSALIGGWLPVTFVLMFGLMFIISFVSTMFAKDIIKGTRKQTASDEKNNILVTFEEQEKTI